jgi:putative Ig domain-containing protein
LIDRAGVLDEEIFLMNLQVTKAGCLIVLALLTAACGGGGDGETAQSNSPPTNPGGGNAPPTIQGQPGTSVAAGQAYNFRPTADDSNGDTLTFTAANLPSWAALNQSTGAVTGTPDNSDVGTYSGIAITVSDGKATATLAAFSITVTDIGTGTATVSWTPPTQNTDGSALALGSYVILYGRSASMLDRSITVTNPSITRYVVDNLSSGTWYFAVSAVSSQGASSSASNVATKTI